ncbi:reactive oxygen species modulator 1 isoform X1 [Monodelphis domestica]|uniref:reactive oxygen species modulator 1 isoform X1 n=1 Tax=Monodelphis domestica TaxID=13616 RepID=UPI0024E20CC4|nr:reactive oxygen species modulator 1 isoform X1 [Monodelphis domestica]
MPVAVGPYGQSQPSCFDRVKMGFVMGCAVGMAAGALFGTFSCLSFILQDRDAGPGADGRNWQNHDAERGYLRNVYGHRNGHSLLTAAPPSLPTPPHILV